MKEKKENPLILSIETSGPVCGVALSVGEDIIAEYSRYGDNAHDKLLAEYIRRILNDTGNTIAGLDCVAVSSGPGSFTGLRIGAAVAKGICYDNVKGICYDNVKGICYDNAPALIPVPTLYALAYSAIDTARTMNRDGITATVHSHRKLFYAQHFSLEMEPASEIMPLDYDDYDKIDKPNYLICGTAMPADSKDISFSHLNILSAKIIAKAAYRLYGKNRNVKSGDFVPLYSQEFIPKTTAKKLNIK